MEHFYLGEFLINCFIVIPFLPDFSFSFLWRRDFGFILCLSGRKNETICMTANTVVNQSVFHFFKEKFCFSK